MSSTIIEDSDEHCAWCAAQLASHGWFTLPQFLSMEFVRVLRADIDRASGEGRFRTARIGRGGDSHVAPMKRGDSIMWFNEAALTPARQSYLDHMERLRLAFNQFLFLGLFDFECHYAMYPPGAGYERHLDQHAGRSERVVTLITYLNEDWQPGDGGELRVFLPNTAESSSPAAPAHIDIQPYAGTVVGFLSDMLYHAVLPTQKTRYSVTGWFRRR